MRNDIECPYCEVLLDINHDDGSGYAEDVLHQQTCRACDKTFTFSTAIIYCYTPYKADCLNGAGHDWFKTNTFPRRFSKWRCRTCDAEKPLSVEEQLEESKISAST